ncbi:MAG TPA: 23S rRNA (uracil(1939)-C(5))-methyltransferase RlmD [Saprospiraceae bacterium]|nr:23S rRNA (uracil(1939)-C(5))-methyltransferase RlmD [Saprospiraceae bacterium]
MAKRRKKTIPSIEITGIADKGMAVGRTSEGQVVFVDKAIPGDNVDALVIRKKKGIPFGIVSKYNKFSDDRRDPFCQHFGTCGGCKWQNLDYSAQLKHKHQTVVDAMTRIAKIETPVSPIIASPYTENYRNKLEYSFGNRRWLTKEEINNPEVTERGNALGFHPSGAFDRIVEIEKCHLQEDYGNLIRNHLRAYTLENGYDYYDAKNHNGLMRNTIFRNNLNGEWMLVVVFGRNDPDKIKALLDNLVSNFDSIKSLFYVINTKMNDSIYDQDMIHHHGSKYLVEELSGIKYKIGPKSFFQTNSTQAKVMFDVIKDFAGLTGTQKVYDLYTGLGSIALYVSAEADYVTGIEEVPDAIRDAIDNMEFNQINNCTFYAGDVKDILTDTFIENHGKPDVVITDPPRAGMHPEVVNTLLELSSPLVVYVSCNPSTQARDIYMMKEKYDILRLQPIDMFPHTHHVENVALLKLKEA